MVWHPQADDAWGWHQSSIIGHERRPTIGAAATPPIKIVIDTDIADDIDDAVALAFALGSPEFDVLRSPAGPPGRTSPGNWATPAPANGTTKK